MNRTTLSKNAVDFIDDAAIHRLLAGTRADPARVREYAGIVLSATQRALGIITRVLVYARPGTEERQRLQPEAFVREAVALVRHQIQMARLQLVEQALYVGGSERLGEHGLVALGKHLAHVGAEGVCGEKNKAPNPALQAAIQLDAAHAAQAHVA